MFEATLIQRWCASCILYLIRFYQVAISPALPARCRYYPTCSQYGIDAITQFGIRRGGVLTIKRLLRCHPWGGSGVDFVPINWQRLYYFALTDQSLTVVQPRPPYL